MTGNPFVDRNRFIMRLDMAARSDELKAKLEAVPEGDLAICDEAHRMSASYFGGEVKETQRHRLGKLLGARTRNLLLMSATPHNGKEADFQLFMGLLDADRFEGRFREGVHKADVSDMMRRLTKEELYRFDGTRLFPERRAWPADGVETRALGYAIASLVPAHLAEVRRRRVGEIDKVEREVRARLNREINYWDARAARPPEEARTGVDQRINASNAEATAGRMVDRLRRRRAELDRERQISALPPVLRGAALVVPRGLLDARRPAEPASALTGFSEDPLARAVIETMAMDAVIGAERAAGHTPVDVSAAKKGWDIESRDGRTGALRFVEVKGRDFEGHSVIVTKNELLASLNAPEAFFLAIVQVERGFAHRPVYVQRFFTRELGFAETAVVFDILDLLSLARVPA